MAQFTSPVWYPCSQMKDFESLAPMTVRDAKGDYIELDDGRRLIDATSSWWCKPLGHGHEGLRSALIDQAQRFEHVMLNNLTHEPVEALSSRLSQLTAGLNHVLYASDGACAVEMAMKMSFQAQQLLGQKQRTEFLALKNSYHGETCGALAVTHIEAFQGAYRGMIKHYPALEKIPYVNHRQESLWDNCELYWQAIEPQLNQHASHLAAIVVEPILQGANGMRLYSQDLLKRLRAWCTEYGVYLIADEILTGLGRTGKMLACEHADIEPDFLCLGKGLTGGWLPLSATLTSSAIYQLFYDDYDHGKTFLHSHTYAGNPLAAAVANQTLQIFDNEKLSARAQALEPELLKRMQAVADCTGMLTNIRGIGAVVAADLTFEQARAGYAVFKQALALGAVMRPIGKTLYWFPALNVKPETLTDLERITTEAITTVTKL